MLCYAFWHAHFDLLASTYSHYECNLLVFVGSSALGVHPNILEVSRLVPCLVSLHTCTSQKGGVHLCNLVNFGHTNMPSATKQLYLLCILNHFPTCDVTSNRLFYSVVSSCNSFDPFFYPKIKKKARESWCCFYVGIRWDRWLADILIRFVRLADKSTLGILTSASKIATHIAHLIFCIISKATHFLSVLTSGDGEIWIPSLPVATSRARYLIKSTKFPLIFPNQPATIAIGMPCPPQIVTVLLWTVVRHCCPQHQQNYNMPCKFSIQWLELLVEFVNYFSSTLICS